MVEYSEETYGERIAEIYDQWYSNFDPAAIHALVELARGGKALELGIGTGRIAIPLLNSGISVQGIDASKSMIAKLHVKPGGDKITVTMGNFADIPIDGQFSLIYVVFNTFYALLTQEEQVRCFHNVAKHLASEGVFVIEAFVPDMKRFIAGQAIRLGKIGDNEMQMDVSEIEQDKQVITSQHVLFTKQGTNFYPVKIRYVWHAEMDLMAQLSGLELKQRWCDWKKNPFTADSDKHISVYGHKK